GVEIVELDGLAVTSVEDSVLTLLRQLLEGSVDVELIVTRQALQQVEVIDVATVPTLDSTFCQGQLRIGDYLGGVKELLGAQAITTGAGARRVVKGENPGLQFGDVIAADGASEAGRENQLLLEMLLIVIHGSDDGQAIGDLSASFQGLGQTLLHVRTYFEAIHHHFNGVLLVFLKSRYIVQVGNHAIDAHPDKALGA